ncbi:proline iminopeptidase [Ekhidna lutea]|uniref:Proline iminopeptidase n=1 Tax=Ekhidna lutea TaxID=447679 RepID=A0A239EYI6_EKHLU|nr:alpha/beta fold hydrolase [Ekhidna lutea]SNS49338.1 proline iminopeptidase [Ekhidna lutea]
MNKSINTIFFIILLVIGCSPEKTEFEGLMEINNTDLYVKIMGSGEPLIVIHGGPGMSHDYFLPHLAPLSNDFQLIFYDQRASGRSSIEVDPKSMNMPMFVEDIEELRRKIGTKKIYLLAHSWGAHIASSYMLKYPNNISGIIYAHPIPLTTQFNELVKQKQILAFDSAYLAKRDSIMSSEAFINQELGAYEALFQNTFSLTFENPETANEINLKLNENFIASQKLIRSFKSPNRDYIKELSVLSIPSMIIHGVNDLTALEADSVLADALNAELIIFNSGHFSFIEQPEKFERTILEFVNN